MGERQRIAAVVVAHDRSEALRATIEALAAQDPPPDSIVLVANAAAADVLSTLRAAVAKIATAEVIELSENGGAAGGFHAGLERVLARGDADFVCCFDDDATPEPGCLAALARVASGLPDVGTVGALSHDTDGLLAWETHVEGESAPLETVAQVRAAARGRRAVPVAALCWHGLMIPVDVLRRHGNVDRSLFLQFEDAELALRLRGAGLRNYLVPGAEVLHPRRPAARRVRILGRTIYVSSEPPAKQYLSLRNELVVHRRYGGLRFWTLSGPLILVRGLLSTLTLDLPRATALRHVFGRAVLDAARGRLGPPPEDLTVELDVAPEIRGRCA
jgi:GT2 family glycosyltransferase